MVPALKPADRIARLRLARSRGIGPIAYRQLLARFPDGPAALEALPDLARRGGGRMPGIASAADVERELDAVAALGGAILLLGDPGYPACLAAIEDAPPALTLLGARDLLDKPAVAIVGARNASAAACRIARDLAAGLGEAGMVVVSGFARGVDAAAHEGALAGGTVAAFAGGADVVYPPEHRALYDAILGYGAVVSELPLGVEPHARHFPRRNRLVSGLASGVVVVEAALRSGSLTTARFALEQGREVMAVPGSPLDPRCRGTNHLLREGARLVEAVDDILTSLGGSVGRSEPVGEASEPAAAADHSASMTSAETSEQLAERLGPSPVAVDELVRQCHMPAPVVRAALLDIELAGRLERHPGDRVSLLP